MGSKAEGGGASSPCTCEARTEFPRCDWVRARPTRCHPIKSGCSLVQLNSPAQLFLLSTGAGERRLLIQDTISDSTVDWFPDGKRTRAWHKAVRSGYCGRKGRSPLRRKVSASWRTVRCQRMAGGPSGLGPTGRGYLYPIEG